jgi:hypothetical protein
MYSSEVQQKIKHILSDYITDRLKVFYLFNIAIISKLGMKRKVSGILFYLISIFYLFNFLFKGKDLYNFLLFNNILLIWLVTIWSFYIIFRGDFYIKKPIVKALL